MSEIDNSLLDMLECPRDHTRLKLESGKLVCEHSHSYPIVCGIPVMLWDELNSPHPAFKNSLSKAATLAQELESNEPSTAVDSTVQAIVGATSGYLYSHLVGNLPEYPIPEFPDQADGSGRTLLDIGCNWGRWLIAASKRDYNVIGLDPDLGALLAAQRVCAQLGVEATLVCGDSRHIPIKTDCLDIVYSYSVLQHLSKNECKDVLSEINRTLTIGGRSLIQMPNVFGIRSSYHLLKRGYRQGNGFEVRYYTPGELVKNFRSAIGETRVFVDGFFGYRQVNFSESQNPALFKTQTIATFFQDAKERNLKYR